MPWTPIWIRTCSTGRTASTTCSGSSRRSSACWTASPPDRRLTATSGDGARPATPAVRSALVVTLLALDGVLCALMAVFFLPLRIDVVPVPVTAIAAGAMNAALVWVGLQWVDSARLAAAPLWSWLATVVVLTLAGPGDDVMFGGVGIMNAMPLVLLAVGIGPAALLLWRRTAPAGP